MVDMNLSVRGFGTEGEVLCFREPPEGRFVSDFVIFPLAMVKHGRKELG
jgi:hypothetical protein